MRHGISAIALIALAACAPEIPDSAAGVGFDDYGAYRQQREAALNGGTSVRPPAGGSGAAGAGTPARPPAEGSVANGAGAPAEPGGDGLPRAALDVDTNNPGISDEQSFEAVTARQTIESDRARLELQRELYKVIPPQPLPPRPEDTGPNIVQYALRTTNSVGQKRYDRFNLLDSPEALARRCARYASSDKAQLAFLAAGGPERDRKGLDPDGDGFACYWDPAPFRQAVQN